MNQAIERAFTDRKGYKRVYVPLLVLTELNFQDDKGRKLKIPIKGNNNEFLEGVMLVYNSPKPLKATQTPYVEVLIPESNLINSEEEAKRYQESKLGKNLNNQPPEIYTPLE